MSKKKNDESIRFAAVRIWVNRTTTESGYADVLVPASIIDGTLRMQACDDQAVLDTLRDNGDCIEWFDDDGNYGLDIESIDSLKSCDGEAEATHVLFQGKDNEWQCIPASRILKYGKIGEVQS